MKAEKFRHSFLAIIWIYDIFYIMDKGEGGHRLQFEAAATVQI